jgi:hypothetical protein
VWYVPPLGSDEFKKEEDRRERLHNTVLKTKVFELGLPVVIVGDWNCSFHRQVYPDLVGEGIAPASDRAKRSGDDIATYLREREMTILNGRDDSSSGPTWYGPQGVCTTTDYVAVSRRLLLTAHGKEPALVGGLRIDEKAASAGSDHVPLYIRLRCDVMDRHQATHLGWKDEHVDTQVCGTFWSYLDVTLNATKLQKLRNEKGARSHKATEVDVNNIYQNWVETIRSAANRTLKKRIVGTVTRYPGRAKTALYRGGTKSAELRSFIKKRNDATREYRELARNRWDDPTCDQVLDESAARIKYLSDSIRTLAKEVKKEKSVKFFKQISDDLHQGEPRKAWKALRSLMKINRRSTGPIYLDGKSGPTVSEGPDYTATWAKHFDKLGNGQAASPFNEEWLKTIEDAENDNRES